MSTIPTHPGPDANDSRGLEPMLEPSAAWPAGARGRLDALTCYGWGVGSITLAILANVFNVLVLRFSTDFLGIAAGTAGAMLALSKVYDAVADPVIGVISDRLDTPRGRRRPVLRIAIVVCSLSMLALFLVPDLQGGWLVAYYAGALLFFATAYALWMVPYISMAAEMTDDYHERSRLLSYRVSFGAVGLLVSSVCGPWLLVYWGGDRAAYEKMAYVLAAMVCLASASCYFMTARAPFKAKSSHGTAGIRAQLAAVYGNRPLAVLLAIKVLWYFGFACNQAALAYFIKYVVKLSDLWLGNYYIILPFGMIAAQPLWLKLARRLDKKLTLALAMLGFGTLELTWLLAGPGEHAAITVARLLALGVTAGGAILFTQSMFIDTIQLDFQRTGEHRAGMLSGLFSLVEKGSSALGVAAVGVALGMLGYVSSVGRAVAQPDAAISGIAVAFAVVPFCTAALSAILLSCYRLNQHELNH